MLMSADAYRESLRRMKPTVYVDGERVGNVADDPRLAPGVAAIAKTYELALNAALAPLMQARVEGFDAPVNRMIALTHTTADLLNKLEAVRIVCQETGCAQRYLGGDALNALYHGTHATDAEHGTDYHARLKSYLAHVYANDLTLGVAMTDAKGDRSLRPHRQPNPDTYVHIVERNARGIVISGTKAIVTGAPYMHELLVLPGRAMTEADAAFAAACAVPVDAKGLTIVARPAGRPGEAAAKFSGKYGQTTGVCLFDRVEVPWERVFLAGEWDAVAHTVQHGGFLVLLGASGAGKSTLLRSINGLVSPTDGEVSVADLPGGTVSKRNLLEHRRHCGMVFQQHHLIGRQSVLANVLMGKLATRGSLASLWPWSKADKLEALAAIDLYRLLMRPAFRQNA